MSGYLSIEKRAVRWSRADANAYLAIAAIGVLAGVAVAFARTPLQMPGHKVLYWMIPVLAARLRTGARAGATAGALSAAATTLSLGGRIGGGGVIMMPMVVLAGVILDWAVESNERENPPLWRCLLFLSLAGAAANLACFVKRIFEPSGAVFSVGNLEDMLYVAGSYAFFGFVAGLLGALAGRAILSFPPRQNAA
jgi:hypothetical protein